MTEIQILIMAVTVVVMLKELHKIDPLLANSLKRNGYETPEKVSAAFVYDLLDIRWLGIKRVAKLLVWLENKGYEPQWREEFLQFDNCKDLYQKMRNNA